jgi:YD repeat-containing protein
VCFPLYRDNGAIPLTQQCPTLASTASFGQGNYYCANLSTYIARYCGQVLRNSCNSNVGHPIDSSNGNKHLRESDFTGTGLHPLTFERYYNSSAWADQAGSLDTIWRSNFDRRVRLMTAASARAIRPDGTVHYYQLSAGLWTGEKDVANKLTRLTDANGQASGWTLLAADEDTLETYDVNGYLSSIKARNGQTQVLVRSTAATPTNIAPKPNLLLSVTDHFGRQLQLTWDSSSRISSVTDPDGRIYTYAYDSAGRLSTVTYPGDASPLPFKRYLYNEADFTGGANLRNALTGIIDENGNRLATYTYDAKGRGIATEYAGGADKYQIAFGTNTATITDPLASTRVYSFQTVSGAARLSGVSQPGGAGCAAASNAISYDANANVAQRTDFRNVKTTYAYDLSRNLETSRTEADGTPEQRKITTAWHPTFRLRSKIAEPKLITSFTYDAAGNMLTRTRQATTDLTGALGFDATTVGTAVTTTFTYNAVGQLLTVTAPRSDVVDRTTYTYDDTSGNLLSIKNAAGHVTTFDEYDASGRLTKATDPNGIVTRMTYSPRGWLLSTSRKSSDGQLEETSSYTYRPSGQVETATLPDGAVITYSYDAAQRLTGISDAAGNTTTYTLDAMGNRKEETISDASGTLAYKITRAYDALNRLKEQTGGVQ